VNNLHHRERPKRRVLSRDEIVQAVSRMSWKSHQLSWVDRRRP
jgi:DNA-directed RNA polymerase subunit H (RpoH/RPB5)